MSQEVLFDREAVHQRLGSEATSDHELEVMLTVLASEYPQRTLESLSEQEWLRAYGQMQARKQTGWMTEPTVGAPADKGSE